MNDTEFSRQHALIFVHIPKTAGSTLEQILLRQYRVAEMYPFIEGEDFKRATELPLEQKTRYRLFQGHMPYGLHRYLKQPAYYLTLLRNPVQTALSSYFYFEMGYRRDVLHQDVSGMVPTVADLKESKMRLMFDNLQTRHMSGKTWVKFGECKEEMLEQAKTNLAHNCAVGLVERFDETVLSLAHIFGWRAPYYIKTNVSRTRLARDKIAPDVIEWLTEQNRFDVELYQYAQTLFDAQVKTLGARFGEMLTQYRSRNRLWGSSLDKVSRVKRKVSQVKFIGEFV